jgi:hypothetical protein
MSRILKQCTGPCGLETKICHGPCGRELSIGSFPAASRTCDGRHHWCYDCIRQYKQQWAEKHPGYHRKRHLLRTYGITLEQYDSMLAEQNGKCAICGSSDPGDNKHGCFCVDHEHIGGCVRALLCFHCNTALGHMNDDPERLEAAARYVRAHRQRTIQPGLK